MDKEMVFVVFLTALLIVIGFLAFFSDKKAAKKKRRKNRAKVKKRPRDIMDDLLDLEFCPGMSSTFDIMNSQRRHFMRLCSRWSALRDHVKDWRAEVVIQAIEEADKVLEKNIGSVLALIVAAGYNPKTGFYQPEFDRNRVNSLAVKSYVGENAELLDELDDLISTAVEYSWIRTETTAEEFRSWTRVLTIKSFEEEFKARKSA